MAERPVFPLTNFLRRLFMLTDVELQQADPVEAAKAFWGVDPNYAAFAIGQERERRGLGKLKWEPVAWDRPPGDDRKCEHGVDKFFICDRCRGPVTEEQRLAEARRRTGSRKRYRSYVPD